VLHARCASRWRSTGVVKRHVRHDVVHTVEAEPQHVVVHHANARAEHPAEPGNPHRVQLDGGDRARAVGQLPRQGAVSGPELEDRARRDQLGDAGGDPPLDEEILAELVAAADRTMRNGRGHG
jgi:hypothetical protein